MGPRVIFAIIFVAAQFISSATAASLSSNVFCNTGSDAYHRAATANFCDPAYTEITANYFDSASAIIGLGASGRENARPPSIDDQRVIGAAMRVPDIPITGVAPLIATLFLGLFFAFTIRRREHD